MTATKNLSIRYINDTTALVTKSFQKNAAIFGTPEFHEWRRYLEYYPDARMATRKVNTKSKDGLSTANMSYENMAAYISTQENSEAIMKEFEMEYMRSKVSSNPYRYVVAWFCKKFPKVNDYEKFFADKKAEAEKEKSLFRVEVKKDDIEVVEEKNN